MDMKIVAATVKAARERRAWSQQHLADASGLSLRTVQRIEANGSASYESARAIAASLDLDVSRLLDSSSAAPVNLPRLRRLVAGVASVAVAGIAMVFVQTALANEILLDLGVTKEEENGTRELTTQILLEDGKPYELTMDGAFKFNVSATVTEQEDILISVDMFSFENDEFVLLGEPKLLTTNRKQASIMLSGGSEASGRYTIQVTPEIR